MTKEQYLRTRIAEIAEELTQRKLEPAHRQSLERALKFYISDLRENQ
ncbi:MAG: hypothetical protein IJN38_02710 [Clostridia bacterium]|nr:hypothetical protein [Clostridia bacterium]